MEKELLAIVAILKEFRNTLLGADITVFTDHKNLTFENLQTQRVIRWRNYVKEFGLKLEYIKGEKNVIADTLSRLSRKEDKDVSPIVGKNDAPSSDIEIDSLESFYSTFDDTEIAQSFYDGLEVESNLLEFIQEHDCFLNLAEINEGENPLDIENIKNLQDSDEELEKLNDKHPEIYFYKDINKTNDVLCQNRKR